MRGTAEGVSLLTRDPKGNERGTLPRVAYHTDVLYLWRQNY